MNKKEFIKAIATEMNATNAAAEKAYDAFVAAVTNALKGGEKIQLAGFGVFEVKDVPAKIGLNPRTQEKVEIPASKKPVLKFGKAFKDIINK